MKITELEFILANLDIPADVTAFKVRPSVEKLPAGENGDIRITNGDSHIHIYLNGWQDLGLFEDERMEQVDDLIQDIADMELGEYIKRTEAQEVISDLTEGMFVPMSDDDIDNILNGGA